MGGESFESRAMYAMAAAMLAPDDMPPTRKPVTGLALRCSSALTETCHAYF